MTQTQSVRPAQHVERERADRTRGSRPTWPLIATATGILGMVATLALDGRTIGAAVVSKSEQLFLDLNPTVYRASMVVGYVVVALLLVFAAQ